MRRERNTQVRTSRLHRNRLFGERPVNPWRLRGHRDSDAAARPDRHDIRLASDATRRRPTKELMALEQRTLGELQVGAIGLGGMPMSIEGRPERVALGVARSTPPSTPASPSSTRPTPTTATRARSATTRSSSPSALRTLDGGDASSVVVATKGGHLRPGDGSWTRERRPGLPQAGGQGVGPAARRRGHRALPVPPTRPERALRRVGRRARRAARRGRHRPARASPTPTVAQIDEAHEALGGRLVSVQNQFSPAFLSSRAELEHCAGLGIAFLPWSPLGGIPSAVGPRRAATTPFAAVAAGPRRLPAAGGPRVGARRSPPVVIPIPGASRPGVDRGLGPGRRPRADRRRASPRLEAALAS